MQRQYSKYATPTKMGFPGGLCVGGPTHWSGSQGVLKCHRKLDPPPP